MNQVPNVEKFDHDETGVIVDPRDAAQTASLRYVSDDEPGITRKASRAGFAFYGPNGKLIRDAATIARCQHLAVPPAYAEVWICADPDGHIQATGRDDKGRKQYRYHPRWNEVRDQTKYQHIVDFAQALPELRRRVETDMRRHGLPREKVLATVVNLLEKTLIRVGNDDYVKANQSYGLTTLTAKHVGVDGASAIRFEFKGKSGKQWRLKISDKRIAKVIRACQDLRGQKLFQFVDHDGARHAITSCDVNDYLREATGRHITAKDFRTWSGTVLAAIALAECEKVDNQAHAKKNVKAAIEKVSARLGNTPTICRKCYIHPEVLGAYLNDSMVAEVRAEVADELAHTHGLKPEEQALLALLQKRLAAPTAAAR